MTAVVLPRNNTLAKEAKRVDPFYAQTIVANDARVDALTTLAELRDEIKFIQRMMLNDDGDNP